MMQAKGTRWGDMLPQLPPDYIVPSCTNRIAARRAITPEGFATAFFKANR
jgi:hypothetical protein